MFQLGRTDTIRSCSYASSQFTQAMLDGSVSNQKRAELLRRAINAHKQYSNDVSTLYPDDDSFNCCLHSQDTANLRHFDGYNFWTKLSKYRLT